MSVVPIIKATDFDRELDEMNQKPSISIKPDPISELISERGKQYGPNPFNQETVALTWQAILEAHYQQKLPGPIPPHVVALMMLTMKACRAATPFPYHQDNYDDMHGYTKIAEICAKAKETRKHDST